MKRAIPLIKKATKNFLDTKVQVGRECVFE